jgi:hypothetical protein
MTVALTKGTVISDAYPTYEFFHETCMVRIVSQLMGCPPGFVQGSISSHLFFQLFWRPGQLCIIQLGVLPASQNRGLSSLWIHQIISLCQHYRLRLLAQNVCNSQVANKLISFGFCRVSGDDFEFQH